MAIATDRIDKLVTIAHLVAIVALFGLLVFGVVRGVLWPFAVFMIAMPVLIWLARRRMWAMLRKHDVRCVACGAALWVPHRAFSKPSLRCPSCGQVAFASASPKPRRVPWFARDVTWSMRFWTAWLTALALGAGLWIRFVKGLPMGGWEWACLLLAGVTSGLVTGALWWYVLVKPWVEQPKRSQ